MAGITPPQMASAPTSSAASAAVYDRWFQVADNDHDGRVTAQDAVPFLERSGLPREMLAKVSAAEALLAPLKPHERTARCGIVRTLPRHAAACACLCLPSAACRVSMAWRAGNG